MRGAAQDGRALAYEVLERIERGGAYLGPALSAALNRAAKIDPRERSLATELAYGVLRWALALDAAIATHSKNSLDTLEPEVLMLLRLGAYQLLFLRVPDHAAVSETVTLAKTVGLKRASGLINAILRKLSGTALEALTLPPTGDLAYQLRVSAGFPEWITQDWLESLGPEALRAEALAINQAAPLSLRAPSEAVREEALLELQEAGFELSRAGRSSVGLLLTGAGDPERLPGYDRLRLGAQDEAAQLIGDFCLAPGKSPLKIETFIEPCAAPGGKSFRLLQALPKLRGVAIDLHKSRTRRVQEEATRLGLVDRLEIYAADATRPIPALDKDRLFELVLIDAPCSGLGTLRRHPEIKLRRGPEDVERLAALQRSLYDAGLRLLRPGGRLVLAICSFTQAEAKAMQDFADAHPELQAEGLAAGAESADAGGEGADFAASLRGLVNEQGVMQSWTARDGMDPFYARRFRLAE